MSQSPRGAAAASLAPLSSQPTVSVVIPCLDEERTIGQCVQMAHRGIAELAVPGEVVVCDNGSSDGSRAAASAAGATVVDCPVRGYGSAVIAGARAARGRWIVMGDADASYDFTKLAPFAEALSGGADLVMGNRFAGGILPGAMPWKNRFLGNPVLTWILNRLFHIRIGDAHCGLRAFTRDAFDRMRLESQGMELASEIVAKAARLKLKIAEVPVVLAPDGRGRRPHLRPWRDGWRHLKWLLLFSPAYLFLLPGLLLAGFGGLLLLSQVAGPVDWRGWRMDVHWMALGLAAFLVGFSLVQFGVAARVFTSVHRFPHADPLFDWLRRRLRVEHGLVAGGLLFAAGFALDGWILAEWVANGYGELHRLRQALFATALLAVGVEIAFGALLADLICERPPPRDDRSDAL